MKRKVKGGITSVSLPIFIQDTTSTTGGGLAVTFASSGLIIEYRRQGQSGWTSVTPVTKTLGTFVSGGIVADGALTGAYELDPPDAACAAGARFVVIRVRGVTNMLPVLIEIELDAVDYQDAVRFGLTSIPNVASGAAGALPTLTQIEASTILAKEATVSTVPGLVWSELTTATWPTNSFGKQVVIGASTQRAITITGSGSGHVTCVVHDAEPNSIPEDAFITGALSGRALASDAATEIATAVSGVQILSRLDSMVESNGGGQFRFDTIALSLAPAGGGGGTVNITVEDSSITIG